METIESVSAAMIRELDFFGRVTASATHQIKNELAVINETASLVAEIMAMAGQGRQPDPARIQTLAQRVVDRVERSNQVVKRLNTFAHSSMAEAERTEGFQTLKLIVNLYQRLAGLKSISLVLEEHPADFRPEIRVRPFVVAEIIWAALEAVVKAAQPESRVKLSLTRAGGKIILQISGQLLGEPELPSADLLDQSSVLAQAEAGALCLEFPT